MKARNKGILFAASTALMWGFLAITLKVALDYVPPLTIVWLRFIIAFVVLVGILYLREPASLQVLRKPPLLAVVAALGLTFNYIGYIKGLDLTTPSNVQVLIQMAPLLLAVVGLVIYKEKLSRIQSWGFIIAIAGFGVFYSDQIKNLVGSAADYQVGIIWVIGAALAWVLFAALQKSLVQRYAAQGLNALIYLVPALLLWPWADFQLIAGFSWKMWALMIFLGLNTLLAYGAIAEAFRYLPANKVGIIVTVNPLITIVTMIILGALEVSWIQPERISVVGVLGALMILIGVSLAIVAKRAQSISKKAALKPKIMVDLKE